MGIKLITTYYLLPVGAVVSQSSTGPHSLNKPHTQQQPQTQAPSSVTETLHKDTQATNPQTSHLNPLQPATTTLTHENSQIHITTSQPQENSQKYTQPQLQHIHPQACLYFFLPFCSMRLVPLVSFSYATTCWPFFSLSRMFHPSYSCTQPQVGLSPHLL